MKVVSLFSGAGGLDLGFKMAGMILYGQTICMKMLYIHIKRI